MGADWARAFDEVASGYEVYLLHIFFLSSYLDKATGVGGLATCWHGGPWDEVGGFGATLAVLLESLGEADKLSCIGHVPGCLVGAEE